MSKAHRYKRKGPNRVQPPVMPEPGLAGIYTNKIHHMKKFFLDALCSLPFAIPFMEPVDARALKVPTYYAIIKKPMDLGTIIKRVENRYYSCVNDLVKDFAQVISNCYTFNRKEALVYHDGQKLEEYFFKVLAKLPIGEEVPYKKVMTEKSLTKHECWQKLKKLETTTMSVDFETREFFQKKWSSLSKKVHKNHFKTVVDFDVRVENMLRQWHDNAKHIFEVFEANTSQPQVDKVSEENGDVKDVKPGSSIWQCHKPQFNWEECLIDALDDTVARLKQELASARQSDQKKAQVQPCSEVLLEILVHAEIINEGLCAQTSLPDSSEDEANDSKTRIASEDESRTIQRQFDQLPPESMFEIMHMVEQVEYRSSSKLNRKYNVKFFSSQTMNLFKKAVDRATRVQTKINLRYIFYAEKKRLQRRLKTKLVNMSQKISNKRRINMELGLSASMLKLDNDKDASASLDSKDSHRASGRSRQYKKLYSSFIPAGKVKATSGFDGKIGSVNGEACQDQYNIGNNSFYSYKNI